MIVSKAVIHLFMPCIKPYSETELTRQPLKNLCFLGCLYYISLPDDAHFAREDFEKLRQFVYAHFSHPPPASEYVLLRIFKHMRRHIMRSRHFHASEFEQAELRFMYTDSLLSEKYGTRILCFYDKREDNHRQSQDNDPDKRQHYINQPFKKCLYIFVETNFQKIIFYEKHPKNTAKAASRTCRMQLQALQHRRQSLLLPRVQKAKNILHLRSQFVAQS